MPDVFSLNHAEVVELRRVCERLAIVYAALHWHWLDPKGRPYVPTAESLREAIEQQMYETFGDAEDQRRCAGGLRVEWHEAPEEGQVRFQVLFAP